MNLDAALATFVNESNELLQEMEQAALRLEESPDDPQAINAMFRAAHTIKGSSGVFGLDQVVAFTGPSEKLLNRLGRWDEMEKIYLHPGHHANYYPGASPITLKLIFRKEDGRVAIKDADN